MKRAAPSGGGCHSSDRPAATVVTGMSPRVYEQVFATILTLVTFRVGVEAELIEPDEVPPVVPVPVVPVPVVPVPVVPVVPLAVEPDVVPEAVEPVVLVELLELESIVPVTSTFWFTYWLRLTLEPEGFSSSVLCAPMLAEPVLPVAPVVPAAPVVPVVPLGELPEPLSIFVSMNCPPPAAALPVLPLVAVPVVPAVVPAVPEAVPEAVVPDVPEVPLYGIRQPVTVMVLPVCEPAVVCDVDGVDVL